MTQHSSSSHPTILFVTGGFHDWLTGNPLEGVTGGLAAIRLLETLKTIGVPIAVLNGEGTFKEFSEIASPKNIPTWIGPPLSLESSSDENIVYQQLHQIISTLNPAIAHIFQFEVWRSVIINVLQDLKIPIVATALDYGWFCTRTTLVQSRGNICDGQQNLSKCTACLTSGREWRTAFARKLVYRLPKNFTQLPALGSLITEAVSNRTRLAHTLKDWELYRRSIAFWIAPSKPMATALAHHGISEHKIVRVPYGYNILTEALLPKVDQNPIVFGYAGRLIYEKGFHLLVDAFIKATKQIPNIEIRLKIFGSPPSKQNSYGTQCLKRLQPILHLVDFDSYNGKDPDSLQAAHKKISVMVAPSVWYDNLPLIVVESLTHGTPVIASQHSSASDLIEPGINGLLFNAFNSDDLLKTLLSFAQSSDLRYTLYASTRYSRTSKDEGRDVLHIYQNLLASAN
jgi:glycosyltransferase involved in cell wall biosynthesis